MNSKKLFFPLLLLSSLYIFAGNSDQNKNDLSPDRASEQDLNHLADFHRAENNNDDQNDRLADKFPEPEDFPDFADDFAKKLYMKVRYGSMKDAKRFCDRSQLNKKKRYILFRLAAHFAKKEKDKLVMEMFENEYHSMLHQPGACAKGKGFINWMIWTGTWPLRTGFGPVRKGFDGACYTVGGILGASTLGLAIAAIPATLTILAVRSLMNAG